MTGIVAAPYWFGPIESVSSDQKSKPTQSKTQAKSPASVGSKSLPENQVPGRTSRRRSSVGGTVSSGVAGKPSTQAVDTSNVPTPAIPVGQSGEMIGVPWTGAAGIIETTEQMMIRERQAQLLPRKPRPLRKELEYERPKDLPQNPDAPAVSQWPPVDESNSSQRPDQPGLTVQPLAPQTTSTSFTGATLADTGAFPPDTMGAVGPTQYCVAVNGRFRTFNKTTGIADGNLDINSDVFFASVLTTPSAGGFNFTTDPQIRFDRLSDRWFIVMLDVPLNSVGDTDKPNRILLAVSNTATITSSTAWTLYQFQGDATLFTDYESLGIDANALYIGGNMFTLAGAFNSTKGFVVRKAEMLTASPLVVTAFPNLAAGTGAGPFAPRGADNYDPTNTGPSATGYFVGVDNATFSTMMFRRVTNPAGTPTISANISVTVPTTSSSAGVPQSGGTTLDSLDDRLYAAHIRNGRLWTAHNMRVNTSGVANTAAGSRHAVRWYEFQNLATTPTVFQSGTQFDNAASSPRHHFIPSIMVSGQGHAAMGCSTSGSTQFAGAFTNGRLASDTLNTLQAGVVYQAGAANYNPSDGSSPHRWGDYSYTSLDPCDDMTMWTIQEFCNATNSYGVQVVKLLAPAPTVTACGTATDVPQGTTNMNIVVTGTGFYDPPATGISACRVPISASVSGTGVTVNSTTFTSAISVTINITVAGGATTGARDIVITNPDGQSSTGSNGCINITAAPTATVTSINRVATTPQCAGTNTTLWQATFSGPVSGVTASNFQLVNPGGGLSGFALGTVTAIGAPPTATWNIAANVGTGSGTLELDMANSTGVTPTVTNVPFTSGQTYSIVATPTTATVGGPQTICANGTTTGLGGNTPSSGTGTWSIDSGGTGTFNPNATTPNATFTHTGGAGPVIVRWTISNSPCTDSSATVTITVNPVATVNAGPDQTICAGSGATLAGSFGGGASSATWSGGAGTFTPNATTPTATYTPSAGEVSAGTVTLTLTTNDPTGPCTAASDTMTITINPAATVNAGPDQTVCASSPTVTLAGSFGGSATSATWSGGAGSFTPNNTTLTATYTPTAGEISAGTVTLILTTNDPTGPCPAVNDSMTITITALATVNAGPDQAICAGSGATLAGSFGGGASSATWSGGAGTFTPNATTPTATYTPSAGEVSAGTVTLTLTTDDPTGPCTAASDTVTITINPAATVNAGPDQTVCASSPAVTLAGSIGGSASNGTWSGGAGSFSPNNTTLTATYTPTAGEISAGTVTLTLTTNDPTGPCPAVSDTITITINPVATVNAGPDQTICAGSGATLAGSFGGGASSATWSGGAGTFTPNATTLTAVYTPSAGEVSAGTVTLTLTTNDPTGPCGSVTDTVIITIMAGPTANAGPDQTVCASSPAVLLAGSIGGSASNGTWSGGAGSFTPNNTTLNAMYTPTAGEIAAGTVTLTLTTNNPGGVCGAGSDSMTITIVPLATVNAGPDQPICSGSGVTLAGSFGGSASSATWSGGGGTFVPNASSPTATYTPSAGEVTAGTVTLTLTTNDPVGPCTAVSDTVTITINQAATVNAGPDQAICAGLNVILAGSRGGSATTATWSGGSGTFAPNTTTLNATYTPSPAEMTAGFVTLTLTTDDPVGLCPAVSDTVTINLINCTLQYALMVADTSNNRIQGFDGTNWAVIGLGTVGSGNGQFRLPEAVAFSFDGQRIYVADTGNNRIQWSTDAGVTWADFATNGTATNQVKAPQGLAVDSAGNLYVSDTGNGRVMRFNNGVPGFGVIIASNGTASGQVGSPRGLAVDSTFRLFVTDETNSRILRINNANTVVATTSGTVIATAGTGMNKVQNPQGITIDSNGTIFVADTGNSRILRWVNANPANASTMALTGSQLGQVNRPEGVTVVQFTSGPFAGGPFLVVGDTSNNRIQGRFIPTGQWNLVGSPNNIGSGVGQFRAPSKIQ